MIAGLLIFLQITLTQPVGCEPAPPGSLLVNASLPTTSAVVEYTYLGSNPLPWGRSAMVATRVWGSGIVERWMVSDQNTASCPDLPVAEVGSVLYTFRGSGAVEVLLDRPVSGADAAALLVRFGEPRTYPVGGGDRTMAWVRVFPGLLLFVLTAISLLVVLVVRRRRRDPFLF